MIEVDLKLFQIALVLLCFYYTNSIQGIGEMIIKGILKGYG